MLRGPTHLENPWEVPHNTDDICLSLPICNCLQSWACEMCTASRQRQRDADNILELLLQWQTKIRNILRPQCLCNWSSHKEYSHHEISNKSLWLACKPGHVVAAVLPRAQLWLLPVCGPRCAGTQAAASPAAWTMTMSTGSQARQTPFLAGKSSYAVFVLLFREFILYSN